MIERLSDEISVWVKEVRKYMDTYSLPESVLSAGGSVSRQLSLVSPETNNGRIKRLINGAVGVKWKEGMVGKSTL